MDYFKDYDDSSEAVVDNSDAAAPNDSSSPPPPAPTDDTSSSNLKSNSSSSSLAVAKFIPPRVTSAPPVETYDVEVTLQQPYVHPTTKVLYTNPKLEAFHAPVKGPLLPHEIARGGFSRQLQNHLTGHVETYHVNQYAFDSQYNNYHTYRVALDPSDNPRTYDDIVCGNAAAKAPKLAVGVNTKDTLISQKTEGEIVEEKNANKQKKGSKKRKKNNDSSSDSFMGPWAPYEESEPEEVPPPIKEGEEEEENANTNKQGDEVNDGTGGGGGDKQKNETSKKEEEDSSKKSATSIFHGRNLVDYQGRSWIERPRSFKPRDAEQIDYLPKQHIHTYVGHTMGVQAIRFFPESGHLLLSAGMDSKIKIWDVYNQRKCLRTYMGHQQGVRDIQFTVDGKRFYSCSYDTKINLWDAEYGKIIGTFTNGKIPYCVSVHPDPSEQNIFIIGSSNKRAVQFDANTGKIVQEYNEHLAAVNTVTFCENNRKLVTTSDDKKIFIWDYGIPVVVKHIAEACMHSMPSVTLHPSKLYFVAQSMDNQILVYEAFGRFRFQGKKRFKRHICAGYAIHPNFSSDGRYIMSGDVHGKLWFWDWKNMKNYRTLECHDGVCIDCAWHPTMTSRVATCGWDGLIKLWD